MEPRELLKKVRQLEIRTRGMVNQVFSGEYHSVFKGRGMEFSEVREYQLGDDVRTIDWNVTARLNHPFVKVFEEERELTVILLVDMSGSQAFGSQTALKRDIAIEISAVLAFSAMKNNDKVGLMMFTDTIEKYVPPRKGRSHTLRIIRELLSFEPSGRGTSIRGALEYLNHIHKKRSIVFLVSDFIDTGYEAALRIAGKRHDLVGLVLNDPREQELPRVGLLNLRDAERGTVRMVDTSDRRVREAFRKHRDTLQRSRKSLFLKSRLDAVEIDVTEPYIKPLSDFFRKREKRY
ncbi:MAG: DUF58 domain-containing protein [Bacteroidetes bacterium]|jgi:uncharacterized protein (DUF58 family)|nr:DUF58 domain-containing protein [Bacteroidota bacterium]